MKESFFDVKTGVKNYQCLLQQSYRLLKKKNNHISLIIVNIDRLHDINKLYGRALG